MGAEATPAIDVIVDGEEVAEFGWHVAADDPAYRRFLEQLLPQLLEHLRGRWDLSRVFFHVSDEPSGVRGRESYARARALVADLLGPCRTLDALSDVELWESGAVPLPVVATDAVEPFLERGVDDFWVYHCVAQDFLVANRFFSLPLSRLRVLGHQLFAFGCTGFLHWGFNFWNSELSRGAIDPLRDTTASGAFPGGDPFIVYPGPGGIPWESVRHRVFAQAVWDLRVMHRIAELVGRDAVMAAIDTDAGGGRLRFDAFSLDPEHYLAVREKLNGLLVSVLEHPSG